MTLAPAPTIEGTPGDSAPRTLEEQLDLLENGAKPAKEEKE
jgi:hypothetical protein